MKAFFSSGFNDKVRRAFITVVGLVLLATAAAKLITIGGDAKLLRRADSIFPFLTVRQLLFLGASAELALVCLLCVLKDHRCCILAIAWLSTLFLSYRIAKWVSGAREPCVCLGDLWRSFGLTAQEGDTLMKFVLAFMLVGSYWFLVEAICNHYRHFQSKANDR